ncbi:hypothetical protein ABEO83_08470 [Bacillus glycinifermentans]
MAIPRDLLIKSTINTLQANGGFVKNPACSAAETAGLDKNMENILVNRC